MRETTTTSIKNFNPSVQFTPRSKTSKKLPNLDLQSISAPSPNNFTLSLSSQAIKLQSHLKPQYKRIRGIFTVDVIKSLIFASLCIIGFVSKVYPLFIFSYIIIMVPGFLFEFVCLMQRVTDRNYKLIVTTNFVKILFCVLFLIFSLFFLGFCYLNVNGVNRFAESDNLYFSNYVSKNLMGVSTFLIVFAAGELAPCICISDLLKEIDDIKIHYTQAKRESVLKYNREEDEEEEEKKEKSEEEEDNN